MYDSETAHGSSAHHTQQSAANGIFVHLLYGHKLPRNRTRTVHLGCVYINYTYPGGTVEHYTRRVRIRDRSRQFSTPCKAICNERYFRTHAVRICTVPRSSTRTVHLCCVHINYSYLGGTVAHRTPGVRLRDRTQQFTTPEQLSAANGIFVHLLHSSPKCR